MWVQLLYDTNKHRSKESQHLIYSDICTALAASLDEVDNIQPPKNFDEAMKSDNWDNWCYVTAKELNGMKKMNVFSDEEYTREDLERIGVKHAPMPCGLIFDVKWNPDNTWDKDKSKALVL